VANDACAMSATRADGAHFCRGRLRCTVGGLDQDISSPESPEVEIMYSRTSAFLFVLGAVLAPAAIGAEASGPAPTSPAANAAPATPMRDGSHDFDFEYGKWRMPNHRLVKRLAGSHQWDDFVTCSEGSPLPGGIGGMDVMRSAYWKDFVGVTLRTYDPKTGLWRIYWVDNQFSGGVIQPPVTGRFDGNVGVFTGHDTYEGKPVLVRFIWTVNPKGSPVAAKWEQAFSPDGGRTWETNWRNELIRDDHCDPATSRKGA
jgi:hypothetical protein